jgi:dUTP pyrophosphatase
LAKPPQKIEPDSVGYDLSSAYYYILKPTESDIAQTDLADQIPNSCYGRIAPRSGLAAKNAINVLGSETYSQIK